MKMWWIMIRCRFFLFCFQMNMFLILFLKMFPLFVVLWRLCFGHRCMIIFIVSIITLLFMCKWVWKIRRLLFLLCWYPLSSFFNFSPMKRYMSHHFVILLWLQFYESFNIYSTPKIRTHCEKQYLYGISTISAVLLCEQLFLYGYLMNFTSIKMWYLPFLNVIFTIVTYALLYVAYIWSWFLVLPL